MPYTNRGVLPRQELARLYKRKTPAIMPDDGCAPSIQPAGLDLRLGTTALRIQASVLPQAGKSVAEKAAEVQMAAMELAGPTVLERGAIYLVRLCETLALPANVRAKANPKSTTGRIDVFVRVICDGATRYDTVPSGYHGPLWLEIVPRSFSVLVEAGISLAQLRLMRGTTECPPPLGAHSGEKVEGVATGIDLSVDLEEGNGHGTIAWKATRNAPLLELGAPPGTLDPMAFFEPVKKPADGRLILDGSEFYILGSRERIRVPPNRAAELVPFNPANGEFRVHHAGFFDPGFGWDGEEGTPAVLEVRVLGSAFQIEHGQILGRLVYHRLSEAAERPYGLPIGSSYQNQRLALAKQFQRDESPGE